MTDCEIGVTKDANGRKWCWSHMSLVRGEQRWLGDRLDRCDEALRPTRTDDKDKP